MTKTYDDLVTEAVRHYMLENHHSQTVIAAALDTTQATVSARLAGKQGWTLRNLEALNVKLGIEVPLPALVGVR